MREIKRVDPGEKALSFPFFSFLNGFPQQLLSAAISMVIQQAINYPPDGTFPNFRGGNFDNRQTLYSSKTSTSGFGIVKGLVTYLMHTNMAGRLLRGGSHHIYVNCWPAILISFWKIKRPRRLVNTCQSK